jgi:glycosyltransferase involved in cell wall biosynthesis
MRIGLLTTYLALGDDTDSGIGQHYRILADALVAAGHLVHVVCATLDPVQTTIGLAQLTPGWTYDVVPIRPPAWISKLFPSVWTCQILLRHLWFAWAADRVLARACARLKLEIVETHAYNAPALCFLHRHHRPTVLTRVSTTLGQMIALSTLHSRSLQYEAALERYVIRCSDAVVTHTGQHRDAVCALEGYSAQRFALVAHGIPDPGALPPVLQTGIEFLYVGRFEPRKGIDVLLAAIPLVAAAVPQSKFTLVGDHGDGKEWDAFTIKHPELINSRVHALGRVSADALTQHYRRCTVFVAPSRYESFGLIYAEAMSHAKPVIGCAVGGVPEVVTDGVTGLLIEPDDIDKLAACMIRLATDGPLRQRMGQAARNDFLNRFSAAKMAEASVELYRELCATPVI